MGSAPLSERDRMRALVMLAGVCGLDRWAKIVEAGARTIEWSERLWNTGVSPVSLFYWLTVLGACAGALVVYVLGPRPTALFGAAGGVLSASVEIAGLGFGGGVLSAFAMGVLMVGVFTFAASVVTMEGEPASSGRFAALAALALGRTALAELGFAGWSFVGARVFSHGLVADRVLALLLELGALVLVAFAVPRASGANAATPAQPPYRAPSSIDAPPPDAAETAPEPRIAWRGLRAFAAPAAVFALGASITAGEVSRSTAGLIAGLAAAAGAAYFFRARQRREGVTPVSLYARALMVSSLGWFILAVSQLVGVLAVVGALNAALGSAASSLAIGYAALTARGRRAGIPLAAWTAWTTLVTLIGSSLGYRLGPIVLIGLAIAGALLARPLGRRANHVQATFDAAT